MHDWPIQNSTSKKVKEPELVYIDYQPGKKEWLRYTRLLFLQYVFSLQDLLPLSDAWDHSFYNAHRAYKGYYLSLTQLIKLLDLFLQK